MKISLLELKKIVDQKINKIYKYIKNECDFSNEKNIIELLEQLSNLTILSSIYNNTLANTKILFEDEEMSLLTVNLKLMLIISICSLMIQKKQINDFIIKLVQLYTKLNILMNKTEEETFVEITLEDKEQISLF